MNHGMPFSSCHCHHPQQHNYDSPPSLPKSSMTTTKNATTITSSPHTASIHLVEGTAAARGTQTITQQ